MATPRTRPADPAPPPGRAGLAGLVLFLVVLGLFLPAVRNGFVSFDDQEYVTANARVQQGLTWESVAWAFRSTEAANWHPLTWLSHMADYQFFGPAPWGHHLTSVLLHALNALLVFVVLRKMTGATGRSLVVAALFGLHPLRVESVAWVSERKDVLSTLFFLLTIWSYAEWAARSAARVSRAGIFYGLAIFLFALGLMSKPMLVTLPFVLLLLDYWPLDRFRSSTLPATRLWVEKLPFLGLALAVSLVTLEAQGKGGAIHAMSSLPFMVRLDNALVSYCRYLGDLVYPVKLAVFYQHPGAWPVWTVLAAGAGLLGISVWAVVLRRRCPWLLVGWLWYGLTLGPVIGLVQVGMQARADRYTYIPSLGIFVLVAWGLHHLASPWRHHVIALRVAAVASVLACAGLTHRQIGYWANNETLFRHAADVTADNWVMQNNLGQALLETPGRTPEAIEHFEAALRSRPDYAEARNNLGNALASIASRSAEAVAHFEAALRSRPDFAEAHNNLGNVLMKTSGRSAEAIAHFEAALQIKPGYVDAHRNLGNALTKSPGRLPEAIVHLGTAVRLKPDHAEAHFDLGNALSGLPDRGPAAIAEYRTALKLNPDYAEAHFNLGNALAGGPEAIAEYEAALALKPDYAEAHNNLGTALARLPGRLPDAITHFEAALRIRPDLVSAHYNLGAALMRVTGQEPRAISHFEAALRLRPDFEPARRMLNQLQAVPPGK